jgi:hypothetical protein
VHALIAAGLVDEYRLFVFPEVEEDGPDRRGNRLNVRRVADRATDRTLCRSDRLNVPPVALRRAAFTSSR